jgi:heme O synthase-like polyprenyltransferase
MAATSLATLVVGTNPLTALLGLGNVALYSAVYTPLKQVTTFNTAIGAVVGAVPPLMGWSAAKIDALSAATGTAVAGMDWATLCSAGLGGWEPALLGLSLFWWQFPHFYSLGWTLRKDYARGGYAMVPCFDATGKDTAWHSLRSAVALASIPLVATAVGVTSPMLAVESLVLNGYFLRMCHKFYTNPNDNTARGVFRTSLWYLPVLLGLMVYHSVHWQKEESQAKSAAEAVADATVALAVAQSNAESATAAALPGPVPDRESSSAAVAADSHPHALASSTTTPIQAAVDSVRTALTTICVHEVVKEETVRSVASTLAAVVCRPGASSTSTATAEGDATEPSSNGTNAADAAEAATDAARQKVRARCPIAVGEDGAKAAAPVAAALVEEATTQVAIAAATAAVAATAGSTAASVS